ncbi:MAG: molybdopterin-dependent oxidoreductase [Deltaproteobacteria bacterium]|nr:molybdopterin-dependent oxidoreductase [Deltaproteobacteria bacterium]MBI3295552.1 molybdopterin-dependent oxidoreductase [Deltaproteobacteria bacterium]
MEFILAFILVAPAFGSLLRHNTRPLQAESLVENLVPWETPLSGFFIRSHAEVPRVDENQWSVTIDGLVENEVTFTLAELRAMEQASLHAVLECAGNGRALISPRTAGVPWKKGAVGNAEWTGVPINTLLSRAKPKAGAKYVTLTGADVPALKSTPQFIRSIPLDKALEAGTLLALQMNRVPLPLLHGGPTRIVLPGWYGQNWIKWVVRLTLSETEDQGFFMKKGYRMPTTAITPETKWDSATGTPVQALRVQSLIVSPIDGEKVSKNFEIQGKAFSGSGTITKIETSIDQGKNWVAGMVAGAHPDGGWQEFSAPIVAQKKGRLEIWSRATDSDGHVQPLKPNWNPAGYLYNAIDRVVVNVMEKPPVFAKGLLTTKCLTCHDFSLIAIQRLNEVGWAKVLDKMEGFGAVLTPGERKQILTNLVATEPIESTSRTEYGQEASTFRMVRRTRDPQRGSALYKTNCATCHGQSGVGDKAPRLRGRAIPHGVFENSIIEGRGEMPAFAEALDPQAINDIRSYLE